MREEAGWTAVPNRPDPEAVVLDLEEPIPLHGLIDGQNLLKLRKHRYMIVRS